MGGLFLPGDGDPLFGVEASAVIDGALAFAQVEALRGETAEPIMSGRFRRPEDIQNKPS